MNRKWFWVSTIAVSLSLPAGLMCARANAAPAPSPFHAAAYQERPWDQPPDEYRDVQKKGFHDGIDAAHKDIDHHRGHDVTHHERWEHPPVDENLKGDYRLAFRRGYDAAWQHWQNSHSW